jgi:alkylhydroperoxidase/carboxymuconolactone decarboxylase family protein YurZ
MFGQSTETTGVEEISEENCRIFVPTCSLGTKENVDDRIVEEEMVNIGLVHLYTASCLYEWDTLSGYASYIYAHGGTVEQVQACIRHLVVFSGYGPCLAAMSALKKKGVIPHNTPGKISSSGHGNAFALVYDGVEASVRRKVYEADPVLENWIQTHLYGDVYSSPGLSLLQKQYLTIAGLVKSNMVDQLYGHAIAALRFGATEEFLKGIIDIVQHLIHGTCPAMPACNRVKRVIDMAVAKRAKAGSTCDDEQCIIYIPDPSSICIPDSPCQA